MAASSHGNNPDDWNKFLEILDSRLQFGLLSYLRRASAYHFEEENLYLEFVSPTDLDYLNKDSVKQQLKIMAHDILGVKEVIIRKPA